MLNDGLDAASNRRVGGVAGGPHGNSRFWCARTTARLPSHLPVLQRRELNTLCGRYFAAKPSRTTMAHEICREQARFRRLLLRSTAWKRSSRPQLWWLNPRCPSSRWPSVRSPASFST